MTKPNPPLSDKENAVSVEAVLPIFFETSDMQMIPRHLGDMKIEVNISYQ